ncbi:uncharacterized protein PAC_05787 [Phialocephala subalpina]|uniref:Uncharacterized protein n=1 Tax=Phialocephala subalpina TaxID=576137 RepID=A0A1L7WT09_9HELO|nr:uncharacterized protein PAC_05787 [Phialocephala subalpina]
MLKDVHRVRMGQGLFNQLGKKTRNEWLGDNKPDFQFISHTPRAPAGTVYSAYTVCLCQIRVTPEKANHDFREIGFFGESSGVQNAMSMMRNWMYDPNFREFMLDME